MFDKLFDDSPVIYLIGFILVVLGWLMLYNHNTFINDWTDIITVMSWLVLLKAIHSMMTFPFPYLF